MAHSLKLLAEKYNQVVSEGLKGALAGGVAGALITKNPAGAMTGAKIGDELGDILSKENHGKKTVRMSYGAFLAKYRDLIAKHTADFIDDDPENEDEAEQMAVDAVIDDLEQQGMHVELTPGETNEGHDEKNMANKEEKKEVIIARKILKATNMKEVKFLAQKLLKMHGQKVSNDSPLYPPHGGHNKK